MSVPKPPNEVVTPVIHSQEHCRMPQMGSASLKLVPFKHGSHGGHAQTEMPIFIAVEVPLYQKLNP